MYVFRPAAGADASRIWEIIRQAKAQMHRENRLQWDESYPAPEHIADDINKGYAYVLCDGANVIAYAAVIFDGESAYGSIRGKWLSDGPFVVVHRLAVADRMKQRGIATRVMQEVEKLSVARNVRSFKVDTNFDNADMQRVLEKCGFAYCGEITYRSGSRRAYEKLL